VDVDNRAASILGILNKGGLPKGFEVLGYETDVPKPTTFILDEEGKVIYADQTTNYRVRPRPEDMLAAITA
jgi:peroxiredoxin